MSEEQKDNNKIVPIDKDKNKEEKKLPFRIKPVGLAARRAEAVAKGEPRIDSIEAPANTATHRIGIEFDNSGSMYGNKITDAHEGVEEFIRNCDPNNTAVAVHPMDEQEAQPKFSLTRKLYTVAQGVKSYRPTGGTPLFQTLEDMLAEEPLTRAIVFSDGEPNDGDTTRYKEIAINAAIEKKIPVDAVYIGSRHDEKAVSLMHEIADRTGGVFLIFEAGKANFRTAFKYLSPGYRAMLADKSFVAKLESGEIK